MTIKKKNGKYYCRFQLNGERHHYLCSGATSIKEAEKIENAFKYKLQQQQNGVIPKEEKKFSFNRLCDVFLDYSKINKKSYNQDKSRVALIRDFFKNRRYIQDIKADDIEKFKAYLLTKNLSKTTVNRYLEVLSKMFNIAVNNEWILINPIKRDMKFPLKNYKVRYVTVNEDNAIFNACSEDFKPLYITALNTGLRKANIRLLKWENINLKYRIIELTENKGNKHIKIYINDILYDLFKRLPKTSEYIFINSRTGKPFSDEGMRDEWNRTKQKAKVHDLRFHDLRHTVGTRLAEQGVPVPVIKEILAHSDIRTTMRYVHSSSSQMVNAMNVLSSYN